VGEGGWTKYSGGRQYALFTGLGAGPRSSQGHVSSTGAASYPQSDRPGAQYARIQPADGRDIPDGVWAALAMTRDPERAEVRMFLDGVATPRRHVDEIAADVFGDAEPAKPVTIDALKAVRAGDTMTATLEAGEGGSWRTVGTPVQRGIGRGAPFTIGRALGLGKEPVKFGGTFMVDGVAAFNRVLSDEELRALSFAGVGAEP